MPAAAPAEPSLIVDLPDRDATRRLARRLAAAARPGDVITLAGALGAGKTTLTRDFITARAGAAQEVPSPSFTLVQTYEIDGETIWHFDLYRLETPEEVVEIGFEDALDDGIVLVEWPDRLGWLEPPDHLAITLEQGARPCARVAHIRAGESWTARLADLADA